MKKILLSLLLTLIFGLFLAPIAIDAQAQGGGGGGVELPSPIEMGQLGGLETVLMKIQQVLFAIGAVVIILGLFYSAYNFVTAQGDPEKVAKGRNTLIYTIIAAIVVFSAYFIIEFAQWFTEGAGGGAGQ